MYINYSVCVCVFNIFHLKRTFKKKIAVPIVIFCK